MGLPIRTTTEDVTAVCKFVASKPTGATISDAKKVIDARYLDGRKIAALKTWGVIEEVGGRLKVTEMGRAVAKGDIGLQTAMRNAIRINSPYMAIVERMAHKKEDSVTATDVAAHWHAHFQTEVSNNDKILNDQAVCFFQVVAGAGLGEVKIGRKGYATRLDFDVDALDNFVASGDSVVTKDEEISETQEDDVFVASPGAAVIVAPGASSAADSRMGHVFITHGSNKQILQQLKDIVTFGKFTPVVAQEHETVSKPLPDKVMDDMRSCFAGIIHVASEQILLDDKGTQHHRINENVLIEIGAAMALFGRNFILLVEKGIQLPSNLSGLYECRYEGPKLDGDATMKLLKAFNEFK